MNTTLPLRPSNIPIGRNRLLAAASAVVAAGSVAVTLAVSAGGEADAPARPSDQPATAQPDRATIYHRSLGPQPPIGREPGHRARERFNHFR